MKKKYMFIKREDLMNVVISLRFEQKYIIKAYNEDFSCVKRHHECIGTIKNFHFFGTKRKGNCQWQDMPLNDISMISYCSDDEHISYYLI